MMVWRAVDERRTFRRVQAVQNVLYVQVAYIAYSIFICIYMHILD